MCRFLWKWGEALLKVKCSVLSRDNVTLGGHGTLWCVRAAFLRPSSSILYASSETTYVGNRLVLFAGACDTPAFGLRVGDKNDLLRHLEIHEMLFDQCGRCNYKKRLAFSWASKKITTKKQSNNKSVVQKRRTFMNWNIGQKNSYCY